MEAKPTRRYHRTTVTPYLVPAGLFHGEEGLERVVGVVAPPLALIRVNHRVLECLDHDVALGGC